MTGQGTGRVLRRRSAAGAAVVALIALSLTGCTGEDEQTAEETSASPEETSTEQGAAPGADDGGGAATDVSDPGALYLFLPLLDAPESIAATEVGDIVESFLETSVTGPVCSGDLALGATITCTGAELEGEFLRAVPDTWDVALVRTTNRATALIVRAAEEDAGELPLPPDQIFHFAYLVGQEETPEVLAEAMEEGFRATQVSDGPSSVDVTASCEQGTRIERSMACRVEGEQPADAAGSWLGVGHDSFVRDSAVYLFVEDVAR